MAARSPSGAGLRAADLSLVEHARGEEIDRRPSHDVLDRFQILLPIPRIG